MRSATARYLPYTAIDIAAKRLDICAEGAIDIRAEREPNVCLTWINLF